MDLKIIFRVARRYSAAVLCLAMVFAGGALFLWNGYKDLDAQKVAFEKEKFTVAEAQFKRELELQKREFLVANVESKNVEKAAQLEAKKLEQEKISAQLMVEQQAVSKAQLSKVAKEKLQALMSEFSALGVDLNSNPFCGDKADLARYNTAKAKYDEIYSLAEAYALDDKYSNFLFHNQQAVQSFGCAKG
jgi:transcriptional regulator with XRE-family HTH domain